MVERGPGDGPKPHHTWHCPCGFGPSAGEAHPPLSFPHTRLYVPPLGCGRCKTILEHRAPPGRKVHVSSCQRTTVANATQPRAPGHERPPAALSAARHGRLSAATGAPGADVPLASTAGAPGQYCLSAAPRAPGHDVSLASPVRAPGHDRLSAAPIATVSLPAGLRRLRQEVLPRVPATPNTLIYPHSRATAASFPRQREIRACAHQPGRGATCCARPPAQAG